jgi:hypothetical protein
MWTLLFVSSVGLGVPIYFKWILDGYLTLAGGEKWMLSKLQLKLLTLDRRVRGANNKARAIKGPGHAGPISFPRLSYARSLGVFRDAQTCFFVPGDRALICWTAFGLFCMLRPIRQSRQSSNLPDLVDAGLAQGGGRLLSLY